MAAIDRSQLRLAPQPIESRQTSGLVPRPPMTTKSEIGDVSYTLPFKRLSSTEIRRAIPDGTVFPGNGEIQCELLTYNTEGAKNHPIIGCARLASVHFKCTVTSGETVHIVHFHLIPAK